MARLDLGTLVGGYILWHEGNLNPYNLKNTFRIDGLGAVDGKKILVMAEGTTDEFFFGGNFAGTTNITQSLYIGSEWTPNIMNFRGDGNVGIGINNPTERLYVSGNVRVDAGNIIVGTTNRGMVSPVNSMELRFGDSSLQGYILVPGTDVGSSEDGSVLITSRYDSALSSDANIKFRTNNGTVVTDLMTISRLGAYVLRGAPNTSMVIIQDNVSGGQLKLGSLGSGQTSIEFGSNGSIKGEGSQIKVVGVSTVPIGFWTGGTSTERMRITDTGYVGIGTIDPRYNLHVKGGALFETESNVTPFIIGRSNSVTESLQIGLDDSSVNFRYVNDENISKIHFVVSNTDMESGGGVNASSQNILTLFGGKSGASNISVVGINNNNPNEAYSLDVAGAVLMSSNLDIASKVTAGSGKLGIWNFANGRIYDNDVEANAHVVIGGAGVADTDRYIRVLHSDTKKRVEIGPNGVEYIEKNDSNVDVVKSGLRNDGLVGKLLTDQSVSGTNLDKTPPDIPQNITVTQLFETMANSVMINLRVTWSSLPIGTLAEIERNGDLCGFKVYLKDGSGAFYPYAVVRKEDTEYLIRNVRGVTSYQVAVTSFDVLGNESAQSGVVTVVTVSDSSIPVAPIGLGVVNGKMMFYVKWNSVSLNVGGSACVDIDYYEIQRCERDKGSVGDYTEFATIYKTYSTGIIDKEVSYEKEYKYRVKVVDTSNNSSAYSAEVVAGTPSQIGEADIVAGSIAAGHIKAGFNLGLNENNGNVITAGDVGGESGGVTLDKDGITVTGGKISVISEDGTALIEGGRIQIDGMNVGVAQSENVVFNGNFLVGDNVYSVGDIYTNGDGVNPFGPKYWYIKRSSGPPKDNVYLQGIWNKILAYGILSSNDFMSMLMEKSAIYLGLTAKSFEIQKMVSDSFNYWWNLGISIYQYNDSTAKTIRMAIRLVDDGTGKLTVNVLNYYIDAMTGKIIFDTAYGVDGSGNPIVVPVERSTGEPDSVGGVAGKTMIKIFNEESWVGKTGYLMMGLDTGAVNEYVLTEQNITSLVNYTKEINHSNYVFSMNCIWNDMPETGKGDTKFTFEVDELLPDVVDGKVVPTVKFQIDDRMPNLAKVLELNTDTLSMGLGANPEYQMLSGFVDFDVNNPDKFVVESLRYPSVLPQYALNRSTVRYIRDFVNGSNVNGDNVWTEISASVCLGQILGCADNGNGTMSVSIYSPIASTTDDSYIGMMFTAISATGVIQALPIMDYSVVNLGNGNYAKTVIVGGLFSTVPDNTYQFSVVVSLGKGVTGSTGASGAYVYNYVTDGEVFSKNKVLLQNIPVVMGVENSPSAGYSTLTISSDGASLVNGTYVGKVLVLVNSTNPLDIRTLPIADYTVTDLGGGMYKKDVVVVGSFASTGNPLYVGNILDPAEKFSKSSGTGLQYITVDLGAEYTLYEIRVMHYYDPMENYNPVTGLGVPRVFRDTKTQISPDGLSWYDIYNSECQGTYAESPTGLVLGGVTTKLVGGVPTPVLNTIITQEYLVPNARTSKWHVLTDLTTKITDPDRLPKKDFIYDDYYMSSGSSGDMLSIKFKGSFAIDAILNIVMNRFGGLAVILIDGQIFTNVDTSEWVWRLNQLNYNGSLAGEHILTVVNLGIQGIHSYPKEELLDDLNRPGEKCTQLMFDSIHLFTWNHLVHTNVVEYTKPKGTLWDRLALRPQGMSLGKYNEGQYLGYTGYDIPIKYRIRARLTNPTSNPVTRTSIFITGVQAELGKVESFNRINYGQKSFPAYMIQEFNVVDYRSGVTAAHLQEYRPGTLKESGIQERHIADGQITTVKIAPGAVTTDVVADENITIEKLALRKKVKLYHRVPSADVFGELTLVPLVVTEFAPTGINPLTNDDLSIRFILEDVSGGSEDIFFNGQLLFSNFDDMIDYDYDMERVIIAYGKDLGGGVYTPPYVYAWVLKFISGIDVESTDKVYANYWVNV